MLESHLQCDTTTGRCKLNGTQDEVRKLETELRKLRERENIRHNEIEERMQALQNHLADRVNAQISTDINHKLKDDLNTTGLALLFCPAVLIVIIAVFLGRLLTKLEEQINGVQNKLDMKLGEVKKRFEVKMGDLEKRVSNACKENNYFTTDHKLI